MKSRAETRRARSAGDGTKLEVWNAGGDESYIYTTSRRFMHELQQRFGRGAEYIRHGYARAWQFKIPKRLTAMLKSMFKKIQKNGDEPAEPHREKQL